MNLIWKMTAILKATVPTIVVLTYVFVTVVDADSN